MQAGLLLLFLLLLRRCRICKSANKSSADAALKLFVRSRHSSWHVEHGCRRREALPDVVTRVVTGQREMHGVKCMYIKLHSGLVGLTCRFSKAQSTKEQKSTVLQPDTGWPSFWQVLGGAEPYGSECSETQRPKGSPLRI